jgi:hypothetical protein
VRVCGRGADTFEYLEYLVSHRRPFVFRSCHSRALALAAGGRGPRLLHDRLRAAPALAGWQVAVSAQQGRPGQPARTAAVRAAALPVRLQAPHVRKGEHGREALAVWAIRVWEPEPPAGQEALEWLLLSDQPAATAASVRRVVGYYECRPVVEEFHKCQKAGVGVGALQMQRRAGLAPLIALLSVVAVPLLNLRLAARPADLAGRPARTVVDPLWVKVLSIWRYQQERDLTVKEFTLALARLGGHQNRKCGGLPGWQTPWRGWERLRTVLDYEWSRASCGKQ